LEYFFVTFVNWRKKREIKKTFEKPFFHFPDFKRKERGYLFLMHKSLGLIPIFLER